MSLSDAIKALEKMRDDDGFLTLDRDQANFLIFLLWDVHDSKPKDVKYAVLDLIGVLPDHKEKAV